MPTAVNPQPYQNPAWDRSWNYPWYPRGMGRPIAIAAVVFLLAAGHLGRMLFWPIGLAALVFMVASGRFGCGSRRWGQGYWGHQNQGGQAPDGQGQAQNQRGNGWQPSSPPWARWCGGDRQPTPPTSGNHAFDEYRAETLRRLEEEQAEFASYLERLRFAKDKAEFDQFMAERRQTPRPPMVQDDPSQP